MSKIIGVLLVIGSVIGTVACIAQLFKLIKKAVRWYFKVSADSYTWYPTGVVPYHRD